MFLLLLNACNKHGITFYALYNNAERKMEINRSRKWGAVNTEGFVEHVREELVKDLGTCKECNEHPAITDYNSHGHYVCRRCLESLSRHFGEEDR